MGVQNGGRPALAVVAITGLVAGVVVGAALAVGTQRRVILYGDSLAFEARDAFALALQRGDDIEVVDRTFGGTAICDRLGRMREDLHDLQPVALVLEFAGNNVTRCMQGPGGPLTGAALAQKYRDDARAATAIFAGAGVRVYWMGAPPATPPFGTVEYVDAGRAVVEGNQFTPACRACRPRAPPWAASTGASRCGPPTGCTSARCGRARAPITAPVYSSGAVRFGLAMAGPVRRDLLGQ